MRRNLDALSTELYCAVSNWNDFTVSETEERILTEDEVGDFAATMYNDIVYRLTQDGKI